MKQMVNRTAPATDKVCFGQLVAAFYRVEGGQIFLGHLHGENIFPYPVLEDGRVSRRGKGQYILDPRDTVEVIEARDLGITKFEWADEEPTY